MVYSAEIIAVGTELLLGSTVNTNARDISQGLSDLGINVYYHTVVGDNPHRLKQAVEIAKNRADVIITTGGLGPTYDDLTKQTIAECFGKKLLLNEKVAASIREYFENYLHTKEMPENNMRQAMLPEGCSVFYNNCGTAPGCAFESEEKHVLMLPGPPSECRDMFTKWAVPYLLSLSDSEILSHNIHIFGIGESAVEEKLRHMMQNMTNPTLAPYAKTGEVMLRLTAKDKSREEAELRMRPFLNKIKDILGNYIYGIDTESLEGTVLDLLKAKNYTLSAAESCTGGLLSKRITDIPGSSAVFMGGVTAYANYVKTNLIGVDAKLIEEHGAVCEPVAVAMAEGISRRLNTHLGVGITGIAGPVSDSSKKEPGTVFLALSTPDGTYAKHLNLGQIRSRVRIMSINHALDMIRRYLTGLPI